MGLEPFKIVNFGVFDRGRFKLARCSSGIMIMPTILIVEDMPDSADLARHILKRYGHEVLIAETGTKALAMAEQNQPHLILFDFWLPDIDARTFLERLRSIPTLVDTPIIVCSATPESAILKQTGEPGFTDLIRKPYTVSLFMEVIDRHLSGSEQKRK